MTSSSYQPWMHRLAALTVCVAFLPIGLGALVTTKDAGMAFRDWPTSDGDGMFAYPWLRSVGEKFLEHGHRLAGTLIGMTAIGLVVMALLREPRRWVKGLTLLILTCVILQGLLGGLRVLRDDRRLALVHGSFAVLVLGLMAATAVVTSRRWHNPRPASSTQSTGALSVLAWSAVACLFAQYVLGGMLRHQGQALYEHLGFAFAAAALVLWLAMSATASGAAWLRAPGGLLVALLLVQLGLGAGAWVTKFGMGGYVAVYGSGLQVAMRTAHVVTGNLLFAACVVLAVRASRLRWEARRITASHPVPDYSGMAPALGGGTP
ncbi:MAG: COX15/CtaA family protein [Planctomycetales bacterium]